MSDQLALLAAIRDNPDDDTPRLIYADWLDEHAISDADRARAEFIRVGCEAFRLRGPDSRRAELSARWKELEDAYKATWLAPFGEEFTRDAEFVRGFVKGVKLQATGLTGRWPFGLFGRRPPPWSREPCCWVWLKGTVKQIRAALSKLGGVHRLSFEESEPTRLDLRSFPGNALARAVADEPALADLRSVSFASKFVTDEAAHALAGSRHLRQLRELNLSTSLLSADGWAALANSQVLNTLECLQIGSHEITTRRTSWTRPGDAGVIALAGSPRVGRLRVLDLRECGFGRPGAAALNASPHLRGLEYLAVTWENWGAEPLEALLAGDPFPKLRELKLWQNRLGPDAMSILARAPVLSRLSSLDLSGSPVGLDGLAALLGAPDLSRLRDLSFSQADFGDAGVELLAATSRLTSLEYLSLSDMPLTEASVERLLAASWIDTVALGLRGTGLSTEAQQRLRDRLGQRVSF